MARTAEWITPRHSLALTHTHHRLELEDAKRDMFPFRASHSWFLLQDRQTETAQREAASLVQLVYRRREKPAGRRGRRACLAAER